MTFARLHRKDEDVMVEPLLQQNVSTILIENMSYMSLDSLSESSKYCHLHLLEKTDRQRHSCLPPAAGKERREQHKMSSAWVKVHELLHSSMRSTERVELKRGFLWSQSNSAHGGEIPNTFHLHVASNTSSVCQRGFTEPCPT